MDEEQRQQLRGVETDDEGRRMRRSGGNSSSHADRMAAMQKNNKSADPDHNNNNNDGGAGGGGGGSSHYSYSTGSDMDQNGGGANEGHGGGGGGRSDPRYHHNQNQKQQQGRSRRSMRNRSRRWEEQEQEQEQEQEEEDAEMEMAMAGGVQLWRPSANLSIETVNALPHKAKRYYQDILGWGEALPGYASAALAMGGHEYERLVAKYRAHELHHHHHHTHRHNTNGILWQAAYVKAFCNNLRTFLRDYNRWMLQHWPVAVNLLFLQPSSQETFHHLALTLRYMNDFSIPIREALYIFKKIRRSW